MHDRANDPNCKDIVEQLTHEVLDGWDPDHVAARMQAKRRDNQILSQWANKVQPPDYCRWTLLPEMDYLDEEQMQ